MSLKKLTESIHRKAEQTAWAKLLVSGNITNEQYGQYLHNLVFIYSAIESRAHELKIFINHPTLKDIRRAIPLCHDKGYFPFETQFEQSAVEYVDYIKILNEKEILAHMYVRHFGDMFGGQIISKKLPEPPIQDPNEPAPTIDQYTQHYKFENKAELIKYMRELLTDDMADEATLAFQYAINLFHDLEKRFDL